MTAIRRGDEEAVEIFAATARLVAARGRREFLKMTAGCFGVVRFQFQPDIGMTQVRHAIDPEPVRAE